MPQMTVVGRSFILSHTHAHAHTHTHTHTHTHAHTVSLIDLFTLLINSSGEENAPTTTNVGYMPPGGRGRGTRAKAACESVSQKSLLLARFKN